jgi:hypothetical protein
VKGQLAVRDVVLGDGFAEQRFEQSGCFGLGDLPTDNAAAVAVEDDIEIELAPLGRSFQFSDIPGPDLIRPLGQ